jgi:phage-related baseplate assembly protein
MSITADFISGLPDPDIIETLDVEAMIKAMRDQLVTLFPSIVGVIDLESEPARKLIEVFAYRELLVRARVNDATRANLIAFALGADLDHLAGFYDVVRLVGETDAALRSRTILAIRGRSPGGTEARYEYVARTANVRVASARIYRTANSPIVNVAVLSTDNGGLADQAILDDVRAALNASDVRIVSDVIAVSAAATSTTDIILDVWLYPYTDTGVIAAIADAIRDGWLIDGGIGRDLNHSWIIATAMLPGVSRVEVVAPENRKIVGENEATVIGEVTVGFRGREF